MIRFGVAVAACVALCACSSSGGTSGGSASQEPSALRQADTMAAAGDASALTQVSFQSIPGTEGCSHPNWYATVDPSITGDQLADDELAFFKARTNLDRGDCGAFLYVFHPGDSTASGFSAGAVIDDDSLLEVHTEGLGSSAAVSINY